MTAAIDLAGKEIKEIETYVMKAAEKTGYSPLKPEQKVCLVEFLLGKDVFVILPTGFGKTVCYACLPQAFDFKNKNSTGEESIIIVVSPLLSLMVNQVASLAKRGISIGYISAESSTEMKNDVIKGNFSIVMISPEMLVGKYRSLLTNPIYKRRLVGLIVDEARCVVKW